MGGLGISGPVLVTGGCGSVGAAVVDYLSAQIGVSEIVIFDNDEQRLFEQRRGAGGPGPTTTYRLGDVRDMDRLNEAVREVDHVVHAAALKHVPQCERQPYESVKTNVEGTRNVIELAKRHDVSSVLTVSTDKATNPTSVMGASKLLAERVTLTADRRTGPADPSFSAVRLGNVLGSSGSVVPVFMRQIEDGGPVTLTDERMTRFIISKRAAAEFIVDHLDPDTSGVTYIPRLESINIGDLASVMVEKYRHRSPGRNEVLVEETGRRPGERLHEILVSPDERHRTTLRDGEFVLYPPSSPTEDVPEQVNPSQIPASGLSSDDPTAMTHEEIRQLLQQLDATEATTENSDAVSSLARHDG